MRQFLHVEGQRGRARIERARQRAWLQALRACADEPRRVSCHSLAADSKLSAAGRPASAKRSALRRSSAWALPALRASLGCVSLLISFRASPALRRASARPVSGYVPRLKVLRAPAMAQSRRHPCDPPFTDNRRYSPSPSFSRLRASLGLMTLMVAPPGIRPRAIETTSGLRRPSA